MLPFRILLCTEVVNAVLVVALPPDVHRAISVNSSTDVRCTVGSWPFFCFCCRCSLSLDGFSPNNRVRRSEELWIGLETRKILALNPAKRQYVTRQSSVVQNDVYAVMRNCAIPYCTNTSPATTINQLYLTYHDYSVTQVTSHGNTLAGYSWILLALLMYLFALIWRKKRQLLAVWLNRTARHDLYGEL